MNKGVAVTGMGIISAIGANTETNLRSLLSGNSGLTAPKGLPTVHQHLPVGSVAISNEKMALNLDLSREHSFTRGALFGAMALKEALGQAQVIPDHHTGFINATSVGGMDSTEVFYSRFEKEPALRRFIPAQHPGYTTERIAEYGGFRGFVTTISTACSSGANAIMLGARMIRAGQLKRVVVGGGEALSRFTLNGFHALMIHSGQACRAFDQHRDGLNLGEGAAYLVLEAEDQLDGKPVLGRITGYGNANDAYHQTASSRTGEGAFLAMREALDSAGIPPQAIDFVNAHGTATPNNDLSESHALLRIFGKKVPAFGSTKAFTGHCLGAGGAVEAVYSLLNLREQRVFANLNFSSPIPETGLVPVLQARKNSVEHVLSNSFGFGGNCTTLIFSKDG